MRKRIIEPSQKSALGSNGNWLDLDRLAQVEVSSEDAAYPIEEALEFSGSRGWRASEAGRQTIRIIFDEPQRINDINILFEEDQLERTQEFTLQYTTGDHQPYREIVRQQYNFSPGSATQELENYTVNLEGVKAVELNIVPDINGGSACATVSRIRIS